MSLIHKAIEEGETGQRKVDDFMEMDFSAETESLGPMSNVETVLYFLRLRIGSSFACRPKDHQAALRVAKQRMIMEVYGDVIDGLRELRQHVYAGDRRKCSEKIDAMIRECKGDAGC